MSEVEHLDELRLSCALDGQAAPGDEGHLSSCAHCAAALDSWRQVARELGPPPLPEPAQRDSALRAALSAAEQLLVRPELAATRQGNPDPSSGAECRPGGAGGIEGAGGIDDSDGGSGRGRHRGVQLRSVAAAVVIAVLVAGALVATLGGTLGGGGAAGSTGNRSAASAVSAGPSQPRSTNSATTASPRRASLFSRAATHKTASPAAGRFFAPRHNAYLPNLGAVGGTEALVSSLVSRHATVNSSQAAGAPQPYPSGACLGVADRRARKAGIADARPFFVAALRYRPAPPDEVPSVVFAFRRPGGRPLHLALVLSDKGCAVLASVTY